MASEEAKEMMGAASGQEGDGAMDADAAIPFSRPAPLSPSEIIAKYAGQVPPRPAALVASLKAAEPAKRGKNGQPQDAASGGPIIKDAPLLLGATLMTAGAQIAFSPNPLDPAMELIDELAKAQAAVREKVNRISKQFTEGPAQQLCDPSLVAVFDALPRYTARLHSLTVRVPAVKRRLAKLRAKSEALAEKIVQQAKEKAIMKAQAQAQQGKTSGEK